MKIIYGENKDLSYAHSVLSRALNKNVTYIKKITLQ